MIKNTTKLLAGFIALGIAVALAGCNTNMLESIGNGISTAGSVLTGSGSAIAAAGKTADAVAAAKTSDAQPDTATTVAGPQTVTNPQGV